jgi:hypothetical protein
MKKSIKNLETKAVKNVKAVKGGNNDRDFMDSALTINNCFQISR